MNIFETAFLLMLFCAIAATSVLAYEWGGARAVVAVPVGYFALLLLLGRWLSMADRRRKSRKH
jgi:hypothetical protein